MGDLFSNFADWMAALPVLWAYVAILAIAYGENVIPPVPGDVAIVFAGYLVGIGRLNFVIVVLLATIGGGAGFMTMYAIGYRIGGAVLDPDRLRWLPKEQIGKARTWLERWGYWVVALNRFLSGARSVISLTVGLAHTPALATACFATLSALVWTLLITYAGYAVGENWEIIGNYLELYGRFVLGAIIIGLLVWLYWKFGRSARRGEGGGTDEPASLPE